MSKTIVLGGGCFWCVEAVFQQVKGVKQVVSGYAGGDGPSPTYHDHGSHAEVIQVTYDVSVISLAEILEIFFAVHDPTTLNQPGTADTGSEYRSIILCAEDELEVATHAKEAAQVNWDDPIITQIQILDTFHEAEDHHQDYYNQNQGNPYCQVIINPKLAMFQKNFKDKLKD